MDLNDILLTDAILFVCDCELLLRDNVLFTCNFIEGHLNVGFEWYFTDWCKKSCV